MVRGGNRGDNVSPRLEAPEAGTRTAGGGLRRFPRDNVVTSRGVEAGLCYLVVVTASPESPCRATCRRHH